jgi:hypothetical protein
VAAVPVRAAAHVETLAVTAVMHLKAKIIIKYGLQMAWQAVPAVLAKLLMPWAACMYPMTSR